MESQMRRRSSAHPKEQIMKLKEIMTHNVEPISADSNLTEAANMMARLDVDRAIAELDTMTACL